MSHVGAVLVGALASLAALAVHRSGPGGLVLAVVASLVVAWVLRATTRPRLATSYAVGWLVVFGIAVAGRPEGDYALATDLAGYTLMAAAFGMVVLAVTALPGRQPPRT